MSLCEYLLNDNPRNCFLMAFPRAIGDPREPYAKSKTQRIEKRAAWAWDHIIGRAKKPAGIGFYPSNPAGRSRWAAMDFDSHDGNRERARTLALAAFALLQRNPDLFLILSTSGGGWHLFVLTSDFYPVGEWARLLRQVANFIGSPVEKGVLEIFPDDGHGLGRAIRAPGTWNPKRDAFSLVCFENVIPLLSKRCAEERDSPFLYQSTRREKGRQLTEQADSRCEATLRKYAIDKPSTRHDQLKGLVSELHRFYSRAVVESLVRRQYEAKTVDTEADSQKHMAEFGALWEYWLSHSYRAALREAETKREMLLTTDKEKEAFRLAWGFAQLNPEEDFAYSTEYFAWNLGISIQGASKQRQKFCALGILRQTACFVANVSAARFRWIANA